MEAPEKIYIPTAGGEMHYHMACSNNEFKESIEYVRTDAFIEKACEWLKEQNEMIGVSFQKDFLERFQNYMKGE